MSSFPWNGSQWYPCHLHVMCLRVVKRSLLRVTKRSFLRVTKRTLDLAKIISNLMPLQNANTPMTSPSPQSQNKTSHSQTPPNHVILITRLHQNIFKDTTQHEKLKGPNDSKVRARQKKKVPTPPTRTQSEARKKTFDCEKTCEVSKDM